MSRQASATVIGGFVLGALFLGIGILIYLGSIKFGEKEEFIIYFDEPVAGLDIGSPVKFRGVAIGRVTKIYIRFNQSKENDHIPVIVQIDFKLLNSSLPIEDNTQNGNGFKRFAALGYRAQLVNDNFITGLKYIEIDTVEAETTPIYVQQEAIYNEIPSRPSLPAAVGQTVEEALVRFGGLQIQEINDALLGVLSMTHEGLEQLDFAALSDSIIRSADSATELMRSEKLQESIDNFSESLTESRSLAVKLNANVDTVLVEARKTNKELQRTLGRLANAADQFTHILSSDSTFRHEMEMTLQEITEASQTLRFFFDYLERNPNALLTGKRRTGPGKDQ